MRKKIVAVIVSAIVLMFAVFGISYAAWSKLNADKSFTLTLGDKGLVIRSEDVIAGGELTPDRPAEGSFNVTVKGGFIDLSVTAGQVYCNDGINRVAVEEGLVEVTVPDKITNIDATERDYIITLNTKIAFKVGKSNVDHYYIGKNFEYELLVTASEAAGSKDYLTEIKVVNEPLPEPEPEPELEPAPIPQANEPITTFDIGIGAMADDNNTGGYIEFHAFIATQPDVRAISVVNNSDKPIDGFTVNVSAFSYIDGYGKVISEDFAKHITVTLVNEKADISAGATGELKLSFKLADSELVYRLISVKLSVTINYGEEVIA